MITMKMSCHWWLFLGAIAFAGLSFIPRLRKWKIYLLSWACSVGLGAFDITYLIQVARPAPVRNVASILLCWALAPPLVFLLEWHFVGRKRPGLKGDYFRYSQELASRFWGGLVIILGLLAQVAIAAP